MLPQGGATSRGELQRSLQYMSWNRQSRTAEAQAARCPRQLTDLRLLVSDDSKESVVDRQQRQTVLCDTSCSQLIPKSSQQGSKIISKSSVSHQRLQHSSRAERELHSVVTGRTNLPDELMQILYFGVCTFTFFVFVHQVSLHHHVCSLYTVHVVCSS